MFNYVKIVNGVVVSKQSSTNPVIDESLTLVNQDFIVGSLYPSGDMPEAKIRIISIGSFRRRMTLAEKSAVKTSNDPVVQVLNEDLLASSFVDLDFQQTIDGLNYLKSVGILTAARVDELLADGSPDEQV
ncbi:hypothetical protein [Thalassotalea hakodatensis]|uniref:hypothetical protein n=1 Tax=Thalassotalea hakodatensis TaxID=3030492 RepID=UPI002573AA5B|nr:hypothetical protein [Thalassotalea hakodatensis]